MDKDLKLIIVLVLRLIVTIPIMFINDFTWKHFSRTPKRCARRKVLGDWILETRERMTAAVARLKDNYPDVYKKD